MNPLLSITGVVLQAMINLLWHFMRDEEARRASIKAAHLKKREEKYNLIKYDSTVKGHVSVSVQCTSKTCPGRNKPLPTTHVISSKDAGDDNLERLSSRQRYYIYVCDDDGKIDETTTPYCPQDDPADGFPQDKTKRWIKNHPQGDGKGVNNDTIKDALNKEGGGHVKKNRFLIKLGSPPAYKAVIETCGRKGCKTPLKLVDKSDEPYSITTNTLFDRKAAGHIG